MIEKTPNPNDNRFEVMSKKILNEILAIEERMLPEENQIDPITDMLHRYAREKFENTRINPKDFAGVYDQESIINDLALLRDKMESIAKDYDFDKVDKFYSDIAEMLFFEGVANRKWFGDSMIAVLPAKYDDLFHGIDVLLVDARNQTDVLAIGLDVASGKLSYQNKIEINIKRIQE